MQNTYRRLAIVLSLAVGLLSMPYLALSFRPAQSLQTLALAVYGPYTSPMPNLRVIITANDMAGNSVSESVGLSAAPIQFTTYLPIVATSRTTTAGIAMNAAVKDKPARDKVSGARFQVSDRAHQDATFRPEL